ncbi:MAG: phage tail protein [Parvibaculum sp.]|uniref:phage tail tape measure protein n=1 Tax=Parvibaculum sp. TaxID=2024848 RepID=UPI000C44E0BA|nr:phage tail tape measure protein [Parvibaculum sp.]MAU62285.1 phage tail protein [Parvibaculum sp.]|tara:strand:+ start:3246 stop:3869 length:624 start_codon:yes stop_codon:yes gene_type:complete
MTDRDPEELAAAMEQASEAARAFALDAERSLKAVSDEMRRATREGRDFGNALGNAFEGAALKGRSLSDVLKKLALDLSRVALDRAAQTISGAVSNGIGTMLGSVTANADGNAIADGRVLPFAKGGVISSPMLFPLRGGTGLAGEAGAEAILPLRRDADGRLGVATEGGGATNIIFNVTATDAASFRRSESQIAAMLARVGARGQRNM